MLNTSDSRHCNKTDFSCGNETSQCIPLQWVCDGDPECIDGSDESEDLCKDVGACGHSYTAPNGFLFSPSYPENYPDNADCYYTISQPTGTVILLNFLSMDIQIYSSGYCPDYLDVRDGASEVSPLLGKLCGSEIPAPIQSSQNQLLMK